MNRRKSKNYTIWIARTGRKPIVLSLRPLVILFAIVLPTSLIGAIIFSFVQRNNQLAQRNSQLTEEAGSILDRVEALESTLTNLQERAKITQDSADSENNPPDYADDFELDDSELEETSEDAPEDSDSILNEMFGRNSGETLDYSQSLNPQDLNPQDLNPRSLNPQRGVGGAIGAEALLAAAKSKLPSLIQELEGKVEPALEEIIVREAAKPIGVPLAAKDTEITSGFGFRHNPFGWGYEFHQGIDFVTAYGAPVHATASGTIVKAEWEPGYGNHVIVDHGYGLETLYAHLSDIKVNGGDRVERNYVLGYLGNTGRSSGPHLHYSVFRNGQPVDPKKYLD